MKKILVYVLSVLNIMIMKSSHNIVFHFFSEDLSDNARVIFEYMCAKKLNDKYAITCIVDSPKSYDAMHNVKFVSYYSLRGIWAFFRAKYLIFSYGLYGTYYKTKRQIEINTWHGMTIKKIMFQEPNLDPQELKRFRPTYTLATSTLFAKIMSDSFDIPNENALITGYPRNDQLYCDHDVLKHFGKTKKQYKKMILWMPTFRTPSRGCTVNNGGSIEFGAPFLNEENRFILNEFLKENNSLLVIKIHNLQEVTDKLRNVFSNILFVTNDDICNYKIALYHLVGQSDALLTDYSSIYVDYLLFDRPLGFAIHDLNQYTKDRGLVFDNPIDYMPGHIILSFNDVIGFIEDIANSIDKYSTKRKSIMNLFHLHQDNNSAERVVKAFQLW